MPDITIHIPTVDAEQSIEIEVKINGARKKYNYRVEILSWARDCETDEERVECLKRVISDYDHDWQLINIGSPGESNIPVMFKQRESVANTN